MHNLLPPTLNADRKPPYLALISRLPRAFIVVTNKEKEGPLPQSPKTSGKYIYIEGVSLTRTKNLV